MQALFLTAALLHGVDPTLLSALCYVESKHNASALARNDGGSPSYGLCQIKMGTARGLGYRGGVKGLMDGATNARLAAKLLQYHYKKHRSWAKAVSAYNAGKPIKGNAKYVNKVMEIAYGKKAVNTSTNLLQHSVKVGKSNDVRLLVLR